MKILVGEFLVTVISVVMCIRTSSSQSLSPLLEAFLKEISVVEHATKEPIDQPVLLQEYDFIVVGAGSAGCVIANRLTEVNDWKVLLVEAGKEESYAMDIPGMAHLLQSTDVNWNYKTVPSDNYCLAMENKQCKFPRGKVMGGSSVLNYMIHTRGHRKDFDNWANLGNAGWDYQNVLQYFKKIEDVQIPRYASDKVYRNTGGYQTISEIPFRSKVAEAFMDAGVELGYPMPDINGQHQVGFSYHQLTARNGTRCSASKSYLHPIRDRPNLHVKKSSTVTKILINPQTKTAYGVEVLCNQQTFRVLAKKEVILSAGAINSPQLLMLSGIGPKEHLESKGIPVISDLPVGENLMDHVVLGAINYIVNTETLSRENMLDDPYVLYNFINRHSGSLTVPSGTEALAFFDLEDPRNPDGHPDLELLLISGLISSDEVLQKNFAISDPAYEKLYNGTEKLNGIMIFPIVLRPKSKGKILLQDSNPFHQPLIYPNYFADEKDLEILVKGVRMIQRLVKTNSMKRFNTTLWKISPLGCETYTFDSDDYWKCYARRFSFTLYHVSGTCKMAPGNDSTGVVDSRLRVKGVKNLRVADASIMPEITSGHTNAPTLMIGEKVSDFVKQDWNETA